MTEQINWLRVEIYQLGNIVRGSPFEGALHHGREATLEDKLEDLAQDYNSKEVVVTENDDVFFIDDFLKDPFDCSRAVWNAGGLYDFICEVVTANG